jgi:tetratricopeptide (TPR) repeat protein
MTTNTLGEECRENLLPHEVAENKEGILLIWLDARLDDSSDCLATRLLLLELNPAAQFYTDVDRCVNLIRSIKHERVFLIVSGALAQSVLPKITSHRTLVAIFIFCAHREYHETLTNHYDKVVGIFTEQDRLFESIRETLDLVEKQTLAFSLFDQKQRLGRDLSQESALFIWQQMLFFVLKQMSQNQQSKEEMLSMCRNYYRNNKKELRKIEQFRVSYTSDKAIEWYTDECFLYKLLNKALRVEDIELLHTFRFFIIDLCAALERESLQWKNKATLTTFRGTQIPSDELEKLKESKGKIISINGFLSTSRNIDVALAFAGESLAHAVFQAVLFEIEVDPTVKTVLFTDVENKTRMKGEEEVLFTLNSLFKIESVGFDSVRNIWQVKLTGTDEGTEKVREHVASIKQRLDEYPPIIYFGRLLTKELAQVSRAEKYFQMLLKSLPSDHEDIGAVHLQMGTVYDRRGDLNAALKHFNLAYEIGRNRQSPNYPQLAGALGSIGRIHRSRGNFDQALACFEQELDIGEKYYPGDHIHKAVAMEYLGIIHADKQEFDAVFNYVFDALAMFKRMLPDPHPYIARSFGFIGHVYEKKGELDRALEYYQKLLNMDEQCLPLGHPDRSIDIEMVVHIYKKIGESEKALDFCRKKLNDQKNILGETHLCIARTLVSMADVLKEENSNEAFNYYKQALTILEQSTSPDHGLISHCLSAISCLYWKREMMEDALQYELRALDLHRQTLSVEHIKIANSLRNIGIYYRCMHEPPEAARYLHQSLSIYQVNYNSDHPDVKRVEADIADLTSVHDTEQTLRALVITTVDDRRRPYTVPCTTRTYHFNHE